MPPKPTDQTIRRWMRYIERRFPTLKWDYSIKGEWVYLRISADPRYLTCLRLWLGGVITQTSYIYGVRLSPSGDPRGLS